MKTLKYRHSEVGHIELFVRDHPGAAGHGSRQVASLIPMKKAVQPRHQALAEFICRCPDCLLSRETLAVLAMQFDLHPIFVVRQAEKWDAEVWCSVEEVLHGTDDSLDLIARAGETFEAIDLGGHVLAYVESVANLRPTPMCRRIAQAFVRRPDKLADKHFVRKLGKRYGCHIDVRGHL